MLRQASAMMVSVGFLWALDEKTRAIGDHQIVHVPCPAELIGDRGRGARAPMRVVPTSWMIQPPTAIACSGRGSGPPITCRRAAR